MKVADLLKFLLALIVVWIHTGNSTLYGLVDLAVPAFFILSGFFLFGKIFHASADASGIVSTWLGKTLRLYLFWTAVYLPFAIIGFAKEGIPFIKATAVYVRNVFFFGENYLSWPLWYLLGLLQAGVIIWLTLRIRLPFWGLALIATTLFCLPYLISFDKIAVFHKTFVTTRNGFFIGLPYMTLGGLIRKLCPGIRGWSKDSHWLKPALGLRFFSVHIYLTHMLFAGLLMLSQTYNPGFALWGYTCLLALMTGVVVYFFPQMQKFLYGRQFRSV